MLSYVVKADYLRSKKYQCTRKTLLFHNVETIATNSKTKNKYVKKQDIKKKPNGINPLLIKIVFFAVKITLVLSANNCTTYFRQSWLV